MKPHKTLFTIHLIEDETGCVRVMSESVGAGMNAHDIGLEILANLKAAEHENPGVLYVAPFTYSEYRQ
jgi:hypothetical protein